MKRVRVSGAEVVQLSECIDALYSHSGYEVREAEETARAILDANGYYDVDVWDFPGSDEDEIREVLETGVPGFACGRGGAL